MQPGGLRAGAAPSGWSGECLLESDILTMASRRRWLPSEKGALWKENSKLRNKDS